MQLTALILGEKLGSDFELTGVSLRLRVCSGVVVVHAGLGGVVDHISVVDDVVRAVIVILTASGGGKGGVQRSKARRMGRAR